MLMSDAHHSNLMGYIGRCGARALEAINTRDPEAAQAALQAAMDELHSAHLMLEVNYAQNFDTRPIVPVEE